MTDGEMRRLSFQSQLPAAVEGFADWDLDAFLWGEWHSDDRRRSNARSAAARRRRAAPARAGALDRGVRVRARADRPRTQGDAAEPEHAVELLRPGAGALRVSDPRAATSRTSRRSSARRSTSSSRLGRDRDPARRAAVPAARRAEVARLLREPRLARRALARAGARARQPRDREPPGVTFSFHLCRGNQASRWLVSGGYDWLAERIFPRINAERLMLEYDDERSGDFAPARARARGQGRRARPGDDEDRAPRDGRRARRRGSARRAPSFRSSASPLSPQCGFATSDPRERAHDRGRGGEARDDRRDSASGLGMTVVLTGQRPHARRGRPSGARRASRSSSRPGALERMHGIARVRRARAGARRPRLRDDDRVSGCARRIRIGAGASTRSSTGP